MGLMEQLKKDIEQITSNTNEFSVALSFLAPTGETADINGLYSDHSNDYDANGNPITGKFTHVSISEKFLTDLNYPTRDSRNLLALKGSLVTINYADGSLKTYKIDNTKPDYTINLHVLICSEYNGVN